MTSESEILTLAQSMPASPLAEKAILCWILQEPEIWLPKARAAGITPDSFYINKPAFELSCEYFERNGNLEFLAFAQHLMTTGEIHKVGGASELANLMSYAAASSAGWAKWVEQVQESHAHRIAISAQQAIGECSDSDEAKKIIQDSLDAISAAKAGPSRSINSKQASEAFIRHFVQMSEAGDIPGRSTGIPQLDQSSGGMRGGELWVIGGQTSRGKSVLMLQIAVSVMKSGGNVAIFSLEMGRSEIVGRLVSAMDRIDYGSITQPRGVTRGEILKIQRSLEKIKEFNFWIDDAANQTIDHITAESSTIMDEAGRLDLIVVDYLQLISGDRKRHENREQEVARISRGLKQLSKQMGCPVISATQLNEQGQTRESKAIAQDSDALLFIVDDGIKIGKLRNGKRDAVLPLRLEGKYQCFEDFVPSPQEATPAPKKQWNR